MRKYVFLDVDGTLIDYSAHCPASARKAVDKARANGHKVYICTGCSKAEIEERDLPVLDGMIGGNGAYVEDGGEVLMHQSLDVEEVKRIGQWCSQRNLGYYLECNAGVFSNDKVREIGPEVMFQYSTGKGADTAAARKQAQAFIDSFVFPGDDKLVRDDVNKISFILSSYQDFLDARQAFSHLEVNTWGGKGEKALFGDLSPAGITKKHAMEMLLDHLHADRNDAVSFGDAKIDLSMFELCGYNVAMGNGGPEIKQAADYITDDVNADGLYKAFVHLGLIDD